MPSRTPEEKALIDSLPVKSADKNCNARTPSGYCKNKAGYGTDHLGGGRCKFHGGSSNGKPITTGLYSKKMKTNLQQEFEKLVTDPNVVELRSELSFTKTLVSHFIDSVRNSLDDPNAGFWIDTTDKGNRVVSAEAKALMQLLDTLSKIFQKVVDAEAKAQEHLDIKDIYNIITQIRNIMDETCSSCPVRAGIGEKLSKIKIPHK